MSVNKTPFKHLILEKLELETSVTHMDCVLLMDQSGKGYIFS
jgi:hypothetical protein